MLINDYVFLDPKVRKTRKVLGVFVKREGRKHTIISALKPAEVVEIEDFRRSDLKAKIKPQTKPARLNW